MLNTKETILLNNEQKIVKSKLVEFANTNSSNDVFILKGSAGTGKTTIINDLQKSLYDLKIQSILCAPTNRAARIISEKTNSVAQTIHSLIFNAIELEDGVISFDLKNNTDKKFKIFIVDESSLIPKNNNLDSSFISNESLLNSLIKFIKDGNSRNKIIFIGDDYQLPPVKEYFSPALSKDFLEKNYKLNTEQFELTQVMRQSENSKVLNLATVLRDSIRTNSSIDTFNIDVIKDEVSAYENFLSFYDQDRFDSIKLICATNKSVNNWNNQIRKQLGFDNILDVGDIIVAQKNSKSICGISISKGDFGKIVSISDNYSKHADLTFTNVKIKFESSKKKKKILEVKVLVDSLYTNYGSLKSNIEKGLIHYVNKQNPIYRESQNDSDDSLLGALRIRHAYAITCHKAQGGEWDNVIICPSKWGIDTKWLYTSITRARKTVHLFAA